MEPTEFSPFIRFVDIASNPYILELYRGMNGLLTDSCWWISEEDGNRIPLAPDEDNIFCRAADLQEKRDRITDEIACTLESQLDISEGYVVTACDGYLQGIAGCWYRNRLLGGIGIGHVKTDQKALLEQTLKIIQGYLTLLAGALEDHDDLELVHTVWSQTITLIDLNELLPRLMIELCTAIGLPAGVIFLINEDGEFFPAFTSGYPQDLLKRRTLEVNRYEYAESLQPNSSAAFQLTESDPLRQWLDCELHFFQHPIVNKECSCVGVPFYRNENLIGIFISISPSMRPFSETKLSLIRLLATSAAAALDNAMTVQRMEKRRKALATIHVIHRLICSSITTDDLLPRIGQLIRQLLKVEKCSIMLVDHHRNRLTPSVTHGLEDGEVGQRALEIGEELPGWVAENMNPILYHTGGDSTIPWKTVGDAYPADSYLSVALFDNDVEGIITVAGKDGEFNPGDREILLTFAEQAIIAIKNARMHEGERTITVNALRSIANLIETRDPEYPGVTAHTCTWSQRIAKTLNVSNREYQNITYAALLHDIGVLRTYDSEFSLDELRMKGPETSLRFVQSLGLPKEVGEMVYHVNEAWNGQGYPEGLKETDIPLGSRIIAVSTAYASLLYRGDGGAHHSSEKAIQIIRKLALRSYDPEVVEALERAVQNPIDLPDD